MKLNPLNDQGIPPRCPFFHPGLLNGKILSVTPPLCSFNQLIQFLISNLIFKHLRSQFYFLLWAWLRFFDIFPIFWHPLTSFKTKFPSRDSKIIKFLFFENTNKHRKELITLVKRISWRKFRFELHQDLTKNSPNKERLPEMEIRIQKNFSKIRIIISLVYSKIILICDAISNGYRSARKKII